MRTKNRYMLKHLILITALLLTPLAGLEAAELYVADNGNDKATGEFPPACVERLQANPSELFFKILTIMRSF